MADKWQGPTSAITAGPDFKKIWVFGITPERKIAMWTYDKRVSGWSKPKIINENVRVLDKGMMTAIVSNDGAGGIRLYYEGQDGRAYEMAGDFNGNFYEPSVLP